MTCSDARKKLSAFLDGAGDSSSRDALARHVDSCPACRTELDALAATSKLVSSSLATAAEAAPPAGYFDDFWPRLSARLDAEEVAVEPAPAVLAAAPWDAAGAPTVVGKVGARRAPRRRRWPVYAAVGALAAAAMILIVLKRGGPQREVATSNERKASEVRGEQGYTTASKDKPAAEPARPSQDVTGSETHDPQEVALNDPHEQTGKSEGSPDDRPAPGKSDTKAGAERKERADKAEAKEGNTSESDDRPPPPKEKDREETRKSGAGNGGLSKKSDSGVRLSQQAQRAGMRDVLANVQRCYETFHVRGLVTVDVTVEPDGTVSDARATGKFADTETGDCVAEAARRAQFEQFSGPAVTFPYHFKLE